MKLLAIVCFLALSISCHSQVFGFVKMTVDYTDYTRKHDPKKEIKKIKYNDRGISKTGYQIDNYTIIFEKEVDGIVQMLIREPLTNEDVRFDIVMTVKIYNGYKAIRFNEFTGRFIIEILIWE